jgi:NTP pyrophosphatase (non-canonical NTP hydrolase)
VLDNTLAHLQERDNMNEQTYEVMAILQEEAAEVIQAVSKCYRFGLDNYKPGKPKTNRQHLEEEIGDLLAMIDILQKMDEISFNNIEAAREAKIDKLKQWSTIEIVQEM